MRSDGEILVTDEEIDRLEAAAQAAMALDPVTVLGLIHRLRLAESDPDRHRRTAAKRASVHASALPDLQCFVESVESGQRGLVNVRLAVDGSQEGFGPSLYRLPASAAPQVGDRFALSFKDAGTHEVASTDATDPEMGTPPTAVWAATKAADCLERGQVSMAAHWIQLATALAAIQ